MYETTQFFLQARFYGKKRLDDSWEHEYQDCESLISHGLKMANSMVSQDQIFSGIIDRLQNTPGKGKVSKDSGLATEEELELPDSDIDDEPGV